MSSSNSYYRSDFVWWCAGRCREQGREFCVSTHHICVQGFGAALCALSLTQCREVCNGVLPVRQEARWTLYLCLLIGFHLLDIMLHDVSSVSLFSSSIHLLFFIPILLLLYKTIRVALSAREERRVYLTITQCCYFFCAVITFFWLLFCVAGGGGRHEYALFYLNWYIILSLLLVFEFSYKHWLLGRAHSATNVV